MIPVVRASSPVSSPNKPDNEPIVVSLATEAQDLARRAEQTNAGNMTIDAASGRG